MGIMLRGRVGDVPVRGAGFQIGPVGGVLATGIGEEIIRLHGAERVYQFIQTYDPQRACELGIQLFGPNIPIGFIALTKDGAGIASRPIKMPAYPLVE